MSELPARGLSQKDWEKRMVQLTPLMEKQVKSYHKARHMGENSSVPVELAQELMESVLYTLDQVGGMGENPSLSDGLEKGQRILEEKLSHGEQLFHLVEATAPSWQGECRWDTVQAIRQYLRAYDWKHLAHRQPDGLYYPLLVQVPERLKGIDYMLSFLQMLWMENQILDGFPEEMLEEFWSVFCQNDRGLTENQCEQLLINGVGKSVIAADAGTLLFSDYERAEIQRILNPLCGESLKKALHTGVSILTSKLGLKDPNAVSYAIQVVPRMRPRLTAALHSGNLRAIFL